VPNVTADDIVSITIVKATVDPVELSETVVGDGSLTFNLSGPCSSNDLKLHYVVFRGA